MSKIFMLLIVSLIVMSCKSNSDEQSVAKDQSSIFDESFEDYTEIDALKDYVKVSDTAIYREGNYDPD